MLSPDRNDESYTLGMLQTSPICSETFLTFSKWPLSDLVRHSPHLSQLIAQGFDVLRLCAQCIGTVIQSRSLDTYVFLSTCNALCT